MKRKTNFSEKSYNRCLSCPHRKVQCNGPRTSDLTLDRWCEYMHDMKEVNGLTNAYVAEKAGVSVKTIERIMSQNPEQDIMRDTARRIESVILGSECPYPCYLAFKEENQPDEQKHNDALRELEQCKAEMEMIRADAQKKIDYLLDLVAKYRADNDNLWRLINHMTKDDKI